MDARSGLVRIPPQTDVPLTPRVQRVIDAPSFRRLSAISQLGLVSLVYPAAHHSRFEHSLGVFHHALLYLKRLMYDRHFREQVDVRHANLFLVAALVHDIGHWPFCHPLEDLALDALPRHELRARQLITKAEIADAIREDWELDPHEVADVVAKTPSTKAQTLLASMLSGPIDVDKVDYLARDSLHAGVPYGRNFDADRLVGSLCLNADHDGLAITDKGRTAAEMLVFARYVMFSEVYWHHAVRSATAMLQRAFWLLHRQFDVQQLFTLTESAWISYVRSVAGDSPAGELLAGVFGSRRQLYKRAKELSALQHPQLHTVLSRRSSSWLVRCSEVLAEILSAQLGQPVGTHEVLLDAPPRKLEVQFEVDIYFEAERRYLPLRDVSPVVRTLSQEQFDRYVKRVRLFVHPRLRDATRALPVVDLLQQAIDELS